MRRWHSSESEKEDGIAGGTSSGKYGRITDGFVGWNFVIIRLITWNHKVNHVISGNYLGYIALLVLKHGLVIRLIIKILILQGGESDVCWKRPWYHV